jgi:glycosyltransferase involved in cell wall biosynthesis
MLHTPKVSIIIPTFNRVNLLTRALDSVIKQTYTNWECIVVDDASTDETEGYMRTIHNPKIQYIRHFQNKGGANARNTGIDHSIGDYVAFLDSDDIWFPQKLEIQLSHILKNHDYLNNIVSYTKVEVLGSNNRIITLPIRAKKSNESVAEYLFLGKIGEGLILTSSLVISRPILLQTKFKPNLKKHQDLDLVIRLEKNEAVFDYIDIPLVRWFNDNRSDRLSLHRDFRFSIDWIMQNENLISPREKFGFLYRWVVLESIIMCLKSLRQAFRFLY